MDLITKGGNYGWRIYEGLYPFTPTESPGGNTSLNSINPIPPILGYNHSQINKNEGSASITGGYIYRSSTDPCMFGRYTTSLFFSFIALQLVFKLTSQRVRKHISLLQTTTSGQRKMQF